MAGHPKKWSVALGGDAAGHSALEVVGGDVALLVGVAELADPDVVAFDVLAVGPAVGVVAVVGGDVVDLLAVGGRQLADSRVVPRRDAVGGPARVRRALG